jgi:hypothetical protein
LVGSGPGFVAGTPKKVPVFLTNKYCMQIVFSDSTSVEMLLHPTALANYFQKTYKHLQYVPVPFREWDNPWYLTNLSYKDLVAKLALLAFKVGINVDVAQCLLSNQTYFNHIHTLYEQQYDGNPAWLDFHEHIHMCEKFHKADEKILHIDYREKAGPLYKPFEHDWLALGTTKLKAGDVFVEWQELGKKPYYYWHNKEPNDINRMCELAKPWINLTFAVKIALEDVDRLENIRVEEFNQWWSQYSDPWCNHYGINVYTVLDMFKAIVIGRVPEYQTVISQLTNNHTPVKVTL